MAPKTHDQGLDRPRLTRKVDPKEVGIRIEAVPSRVLAQLILLIFFVMGNGARYMV